MIRLHLLALVFLSTVATQTQAQSNEELGQMAARFQGYEVSKMSVEGLDSSVSKGLVNGLALKGKWKLINREVPVLFPRTLTEDLNRADLYLARNGFPYAVVTPELEPDVESRKVAVRLRVRSGPAVRVEKKEIVGCPPELGAKAEDTITFEDGTRFRDNAVKNSAELLTEMIKKNGYARVKVTHQVVRNDSTRVLVRFQVDPGPYFTFGEVSVDGPCTDLLTLARRTVLISPGTRYSPEEIDKAEERLRLLDLFRQIRFTLVDRPDEDVLDLDLFVSDRDPRSFKVGVGFWTDELFRGNAIWQHRNLFGGGRGFRVLGAYSQYEHRAETGLWWPGVLHPQIRVEFVAGIEKENEDSYKQLTNRAGLSSIYRPSFRASYRVGYEIQDVDLTLAEEGAGGFTGFKGLLSIFSAGASLDDADDPLDPTSGETLKIDGELSPSNGFSDSPYAGVDARSTLYVSPVRKTVVAGRLEGGVVSPLGDNPEVLPTKRFYAGGMNSMRGFSRRALGPTDSQGRAIGGEVIFLGSLEVRFPLLWKLGGAAFVDTGQVWSKRDLVRFDEIEVAIGGSVMFRTPIGPVRADYAVRRTNIIPGQPRDQFHFAIGHPF